MCYRTERVNASQCPALSEGAKAGGLGGWRYETAGPIRHSLRNRCWTFVRLITLNQCRNRSGPCAMYRRLLPLRHRSHMCLGEELLRTRAQGTVAATAIGLAEPFARLVGLRFASPPAPAAPIARRTCGPQGSGPGAWQSRTPEGFRFDRPR